MTLWRFVPDSLRAAEAESMFESAVTQPQGGKRPDARIIWARAAIAWAERPADIERLIALADGKEEAPDFTFDQEMRWAIAIKAVAYAVPGADERIEAEAQARPVGPRPPRRRSAPPRLLPIARRRTVRGSRYTVTATARSTSPAPP